MTVAIRSTSGANFKFRFLDHPIREYHLIWQVWKLRPERLGNLPGTTLWNQYVTPGPQLRTTMPGPVLYLQAQVQATEEATVNPLREQDPEHGAELGKKGQDPRCEAGLQVGLCFHWGLETQRRN